ncbi:hypothetical protein MS2017_1944 [Bathymodiolus thermophilus thioautotrophic gill symbiont]|uniref:DUF4145 domain-containing protein n=1 Tax=Bathymodiolus thermophilus thioautotrophic gill symbiont TaxID=2360 RepID=A0A3G3IP09_9GAMM|nr:DUF4145 domain-containing protein [Bathymodiolus thermophilus thioautotrophic gill symbiont]AYQ57606.1 hypothetical protein MS2017_1944 [Bathymodiolus thermophilus thioautotrophic gill symbiont]
MEEVKLKAQCNKCLGETNHLLLHKEDQPWDEDMGCGNIIYGSETFNMVKCCGCDSVKLMYTSWFSGACDEDGPIIETNYYPPAISRAEPKWVSSLGGFFSQEQERYSFKLLREIYSALHNDSRCLAVMGIRALLEHLMIAKVTDKGTFKKNLDAFQAEGYLSKKQRGIIEPILEAGHAAIHRAYHPSSEDVLTAIEVTESLVETIYVHPKKANKLKERVPKRNE